MFVLAGFLRRDSLGRRRGVLGATTRSIISHAVVLGPRCCKTSLLFDHAQVQSFERFRLKMTSTAIVPFAQSLMVPQ